MHVYATRRRIARQGLMNCSNDGINNAPRANVYFFLFLDEPIQIGHNNVGRKTIRKLRGRSIQIHVEVYVRT